MRISNGSGTEKSEIMMNRLLKLFVLFISVASLALALATVPAQAETQVSPETNDVCDSLQIAYESTSCSDGSIMNVSATLEGGADVAIEAEAAVETAEAVDERHESGWAYEDGAWYYFDEDGILVTNSRVWDNGIYYYFDADGHIATTSTSSATGSLAAITDACYSTPSTGSGGCAAWVSNVFANAGIGRWNGNACDFYWSWCTSSDLADLKPGMIIAVSSCAGTSASIAYGHVGIYLGNGIVMQNLLGSVGTMSLDTWLDYFDGYSTPAWGWLGGVVLY